MKAQRHPSEPSRFWLTILLVAPILLIAILLVFATIGLALLAVGVIVLMIWVTTKLAVARYLGNHVKVSVENFSDINSAIEEYKALFAYPGKIDAYVYEAGSYNAFIVPLLRRKVILINSDVVAGAESDNEVRWIVARFIGALASKHYRFIWLQVVISTIEKIMIFNMLLYPYERAVAKSGDQLELYAIGGDVKSAIRALQRMMVGGALGGGVTLSGVLRQHEAISGTFFGWLAKSLSPFPHTTTRVVNLLSYAGEQFPDRARALLAEADDTTLSRVRSAADQPDLAALA